MVHAAQLFANSPKRAFDGNTKMLKDDISISLLESKKQHEPSYIAEIPVIGGALIRILLLFVQYC
jgi:hypothetical protein